MKFSIFISLHHIIYCSKSEVIVYKDILLSTNYQKKVQNRTFFISFAIYADIESEVTSHDCLNGRCCFKISLQIRMGIFPLSDIYCASFIV